MIINIITPCSRPENLNLISESINIPKENYRWIVVFDLNEFPDENLIPKNCEVYLHKNPNSVVGNSQRNFGVDLISDGYIYFNDDDTLIHPNLWENIKNIDADFISFNQVDKDNTLRLKGDCVKINSVDSHNFIVSYDIAKNTKWELEHYNSDGIFASECYEKSKNKIFIDKVLSIYNQLR